VRIPTATEGIVPGSVAGGRICGGILHLPDAVERYPGAGLVVYNRVSSWSQAGKRKPKEGIYGELLENKTHAIVTEVLKLDPRNKLRFISRGIEKGKVSSPRPQLLRAAKFAACQHKPMIIVASDLSRFIRSESYHHQKNPEAQPTPEEFARLHEMTYGVPLATIEHPSMSEAERHSKAVKRTGRCGRPGSIDPELAERIFAALGHLCIDVSGRFRWQRPLSEVAQHYRVTVRSVRRAYSAIAPNGKTWRDNALEKAEAEGLLKINGDEILPVY
jgi:hypothetical protein